MTDDEWPEGWRDRQLDALREADDRLDAAQRVWPTGPVYARLEIARTNLAQAATMIERGA